MTLKHKFSVPICHHASALLWEPLQLKMCRIEFGYNLAGKVDAIRVEEVGGNLTGKRNANTEQHRYLDTCAVRICTD